MHAFNRFTVTKSVTNTWIADFNQFVNNILFVFPKVKISATISRKTLSVMLRNGTCPKEATYVIYLLFNVLIIISGHQI